EERVKHSDRACPGGAADRDAAAVYTHGREDAKAALRDQRRVAIWLARSRSLSPQQEGAWMADTLWVHCNRCSSERKHKLLHAEKRLSHDREPDLEGASDYELFECLGGGAIIFPHTSWDSATEEAIVYSPPQVARRKPRWLSDLRRGATS